MKFAAALTLAALVSSATAVHAQEPVTPAPDSDALFHSSNPKLNANKQVIYHLIKDILMSGHVELAPKYMSQRYIQHNPNFASGREPLLKMVSSFSPPQPIPAKMRPVIVSVVAEGDMVVVAQVAQMPDNGNPSSTHAVTEFDMWRVKNGKADEHWDGMAFGKPPMPGRPPAH